MATKEQALDLLATGVTAGATRGVSAALKVPTTNLSGLSQHAAYNTVRAGVSTGVNIAMGQKPSDALKGGAASIITGTLGGIAANALSGMRIDAAQAGDSLLGRVNTSIVDRL